MAEEEGFKFTQMPPPAIKKDIMEFLDKWGFSDKLKFQSFSFNNHFQPYLKEPFAQDFFKSPTINNILQTISGGGQLMPLALAKEIDRVLVEEVPCSVLSMDFFDVLWKSGVVRESGSVVKCFDEPYGDFLISDRLRECLLQEESDLYTTFSQSERHEFIFRLFKHLQLGGRINQYEDVISPYLDTCKVLYKQLVTVVKDINTKSLSVSSTVLAVQAKVKGELVFPGKGLAHEQSFCYLIIDNIKRLVTVCYHIWN